MKSNPGGYIAPEHAIGRDQTIEEIWETLTRQSIYISAERRIGKTTVLRKLEAEPRPGFTLIQRDLESIHSADGFAAAVYRDVDTFLTGRKRAKRRLVEFVNLAGGSEVGGVFKLPNNQPVPWKMVLEKSVEDLSESFSGDGGRLVFLWDEVPFMLNNIVQREGERTAMEVLDVLRYLRQTHPALRMILTGSIGLHHVLSALKKRNYSNSPINDMYACEIGPFSPADGARLALLLFQGEAISGRDLDRTALALSTAVDHFPFYVHHLVLGLKRRAAGASVHGVEEALKDILQDPNDPWQLRHYRARLGNYYGEDEGIALSVLDAAACTERLSFTTALGAVKSLAEFNDQERLRDLLTRLQQDHYLCRVDGGYVFSFNLIKRWWRIDRDLDSTPRS
jgi:hypothetical protein